LYAAVVVSACIKAGDGISTTVFDFDIVFAAITATFLAVVDQSNSCTLIGGKAGLVQLQLAVKT